MALAAVEPAMNFEPQKDVHPFFAKPLRNPSPERKIVANTTDADAGTNGHDPEQPDTSAQGSGTKQRKKRTRHSAEVKDKKDGGKGHRSQALLEKFTRPRGHSSGIMDTSSEGNQPILEDVTLVEDPNADRKKRRKPTLPNPADRAELRTHTGSLNWLQQLQIGADGDADTQLEGPKEDQANGHALEPSSEPELETSAELTKCEPIQVDEPAPAIDIPAEQKVEKKRILKVNKNGKLLSSPTIKPDPEVPPSPKKRRVRKSKAKIIPSVTVIRYGTDANSRKVFGRKIEDILNGKGTTRVPQLAKPAKKPVKPSEPPKATHPFFRSKAKNDKVSPAQTIEPAPAPSIPKRSAVTPGKLRAERGNHHLSQPFPAFGPIAGDSRIMKQPGMSEAPWPSKDTAHVRNLSLGDRIPSFPDDCLGDPKLGLRKQKNIAMAIPEEENLIARLARQLGISSVGKAEGVAEGPTVEDTSRLPSRLLTTGVDIQERVRSQVRSALHDCDEADNEQHGKISAINQLFRDIEHTLTPFDRGECEMQAWVQKYAPSRASHVLQLGKDALILRDWLQSLTIRAVDSGKDTLKSVSSETKRPPRKKRKKVEDDFIVDNDEYGDEDEDLIEVLDEEKERGQPNGSWPLTKSLRISRFTRNRNVVVLSGPHGCGKSAAVYAAAKELGFEVFEINSGSRRSGKDVLEKVGDMTANHLVSHNRSEVKAKQEVIPADDTDNERMSSALQKDLESGRQGTMTSFFTSNPQPKAKPAPKLTSAAREIQRPDSTTQATLTGVQPARKQQKQSLILFEEADVIFEEDQQFWAQVIKLASQSKRPIVITCNNEALLPIYSLPLAAILRFSPPPIELATDYLLLIAAREGHILERRAVTTLFKGKGHDLRASIADLNFWCQMSVGDRKGGLEWIYQRWPPGKDVDGQGRTLRVASQGTYRAGMGWFSHDVLSSSDCVGFSQEEELLTELWTEWGLTPTSWSETQESEPTIATTPDHLSRLDDLKRMDLLWESVSAVDTYCRIGLPTYDDPKHEPTDSSLPSIPVKERSNYTEAARLLQVDHLSDFTSFDTSMLIQSHLSIQRNSSHSVTFSLNGGTGRRPADEDGFIKAILGHKRDEHRPKSLRRSEFSEAFDVLASPPAATLALNTSYQLTASCFDRTLKIVTEDLAPFVRSIVAHEICLEHERIRLGNLLSEGGRSKRPRTTRASRVALEGGSRETKRREFWFDADLNRTLVMATAGKSWTGLGSMTEETETSSRAGDSVLSSNEA